MEASEALILARNQHQLFGLHGSLWSESTTPETREQLRQLVAGVLVPGSGGSAFHTQTLSGSVPGLEDYLRLDLGPANVWQVNTDVAAELNDIAGTDPVSVFGSLDPYAHTDLVSLYEGGTTLPTEYGQILLWPDGGLGSSVTIRAQDGIPTWLVATESDLRISRIQTQTGDWLVRGVDFQSEYGILVLYQDPSVVFPTQAAVASGVRKPTGSYNYSLLLDGIPTPGYWVWYYYRNGQSLESFRRALAEASGVHVWYHDSYIVDVRTQPVGAIYTTTREKVYARYPHTLLSVGQGVGRGQVLDSGYLAVVESGGALEISLYEPLFAGIFLTRAQNFIHRCKPLTVPVSVTEIPDT